MKIQLFSALDHTAPHSLAHYAVLNETLLTGQWKKVKAIVAAVAAKCA